MSLTLSLLRQLSVAEYFYFLRGSCIFEFDLFHHCHHSFGSSDASTTILKKRSFYGVLTSAGVATASSCKQCVWRKNISLWGHCARYNKPSIWPNAYRLQLPPSQVLKTKSLARKTSYPKHKPYTLQVFIKGTVILIHEKSSLSLSLISFLSLYFSKSCLFER